MDEVVMAGGKKGTANRSYYLYNGQSYWTMSPYYYFFRANDSARYAHVFRVSEDFWNANVSNTGISVRPVINLRADVQISGSGTGTDPFVVN